MEKKQLLIIDSNEKRAEKYYSAVKHLFHEFHIAVSYSSAENYIKTHKFDMIIISPFVSDKSIRDCLKELRHNRKTSVIPIIVVSNLPEKTSKIDLYAYGADEYFELPMNRELFEKTVRRELLQYERISQSQGLDAETGLVDREKYKESIRKSIQNIQKTGDKVAIGIIAPVAIDYVIKEYEPAMADRLIKLIVEIIEKNCKGQHILAHWTQKSLSFSVVGADNGIIRQTMEIVRKEYLRRVDFIPKLQTTSGLRAVISELDPEQTIEDQLQALSMHLAFISSTNGDPVQIMELVRAGRKEIVIADPDQVSKNIMTHKFGQDGFKIHETDEFDEILEIAESDQLAVIIIDTMVRRR